MRVRGCCDVLAVGGVVVVVLTERSGGAGRIGSLGSGAAGAY